MTDEQGAVIAHALLTATEASTGARFTQESTGEGLFSLRALPLGTYTLVISSPGFSDQKLQNIRVQAGSAVTAPTVILRVGNTVTVDVSSTQTLLETTEAQSTTVLEKQSIVSLPVNSGKIDNLALLSPGVTTQHGVTFASSNGSNLTVNGQNSRFNDYEIDGQTNNSNMLGGSLLAFRNVDALAEFQVISNSPSAQYGRNSGAVVNYVTKAGTNGFHGSAFEYYIGSWGSSLANNQKSPLLGYCNAAAGLTTGCTIPQVARQDTNNYGGTFGGPILRDRLWFFGSTFFSHVRNGATAYSSGGNVYPTANGVTQLAAAFPNNPVVAAYKSYGPFASSIGTVVAVNPATKAVSDGTTTANVEFAGIRRTLATQSGDQQELFRLDYQPTTKDHLYIRYIYDTSITAPGGGTVYTGAFVNTSGNVYSVGADLTHAFSAHWVNQLRYSFSQYTSSSKDGGLPGCSTLNYGACPSAVTLSGGGFGSFGLAVSYPQGLVQKNHQVQDNANWSHGRHSIAFGGEFDYQNTTSLALGSYGGSLTFANFNSFLQGVGTLTIADGSLSQNFKEPDLAFYIQDDYKAFSSLTLNLGIRYECYGQAVNQLADRTRQQQLGSNPLWNVALPLSETTLAKVNPYNKNIEPRVGLAYSPTGKVSIRAGFGIMVNPAFYNIYTQMSSAAPSVNSGTVTCGAAHQCLPSSGIGFNAVRAQNLSLLPRGVDPGARSQSFLPLNFRNPFTESYTLSVQYQAASKVVTELRYSGNHVSQNFQSYNGNPYLLDVATAFSNYYSAASLCTTTTASGTLAGADVGRQHCGATNVRYRANTAFSIYNALQANVVVRDYHGLTLNGNFTYSRQIDNSSDIFGTQGSLGTSGGQPIAYAQDPLNTNIGERAAGANNVPLAATAGLTYRLPWFETMSGWRGRLLGGYSVNTIWVHDSGQPYTPLQSKTASLTAAALAKIGQTALTTTQAQSFCDNGFDTAFNTNADTCRPVLSNPKAPLGSVGFNTGSKYIDYYTGNTIARSDVHWIWNNRAEALALHTPFPGVSRNTLTTNAYDNVDLSVYKTTRIFERASLRLQIDAFNALNHQYVAAPDGNIEDYQQQGNATYSAFGFNPFLSTKALTSNNRTIQLGAKVLF